MTTICTSKRNGRPPGTGGLEDLVRTTILKDPSYSKVAPLDSWVCWESRRQANAITHNHREQYRCHRQTEKA